MPEILHKRITTTAVDKLQPGEILRDTELTGFGVRRQAGGPIYFLQKRIGGKIRWMTIGQHGSPWTVSLARKEALRLMRDIAAGIDPQEQKQLDLAKVTLEQAAPQFMAEHGPKLKPRTREEYERLFKLHILPRLGSIKLEKLSRIEVTRFHASLADKPSGANFALAVLSKMMTWAEHTGRRPEGSNPCKGIKKYRARKRERYLTADELTRLGQSLINAETAATESPFAIAAIRLLLLTGARRNEILTLRWSEVDFDRQVLRLPDSKTGEKVIKLGPPALRLLTNLPRVKGNPHVIVGERTGQHLVNIQATWERLREAAGITDVRLHDLRHSFASIAVAAGASLPMIGKLLGHTQPQTTARYAHLADDPITQLNNSISDAIGAAIMPNDNGDDDETTNSGEEQR